MKFESQMVQRDEYMQCLLAEAGQQEARMNEEMEQRINIIQSEAKSQACGRIDPIVKQYQPKFMGREAHLQQQEQHTRKKGSAFMLH